MNGRSQKALFYHKFHTTEWQTNKHRLFVFHWREDYSNVKALGLCLSSALFPFLLWVIIKEKCLWRILNEIIFTFTCLVHHFPIWIRWGQNRLALRTSGNPQGNYSSGGCRARLFHCREEISTLSWYQTRATIQTCCLIWDPDWPKHSPDSLEHNNLSGCKYWNVQRSPPQMWQCFRVSTFHEEMKIVFKTFRYFRSTTCLPLSLISILFWCF